MPLRYLLNALNVNVSTGTHNVRRLEIAESSSYLAHISVTECDLI